MYLDTSAFLGLQVGMQLEAEKAALLQKKREQQIERKRKQDELDRILQENKRKVSPHPFQWGVTRLYLKQEITGK